MPGPVRTLGEVIGASNDTLKGDVHTSYVGVVKSYKPSTMRAEIESAVHQPIKLANGSFSFQPLPIVPEVPICFMSAPGNSIVFPIAQGTPVLMICTVLDPSQFRFTGQIGPPGQTRRHAIGYAHAFPSVPLGGPGTLPPAHDLKMVIEGVDGIQLGENASDFVALAALVLARLNTIQTTFDAHTHPYLPGPGPSAPTSVTGTLIGTLAPVAATKVEAE